MIYLSQAKHQMLRVTQFQDLVSRPFKGEINAMCWSRELVGDFAEIVGKAYYTSPIHVPKRHVEAKFFPFCILL
ncbi:hypothetical protein EGI22_22105 [Lacihabitans sp. LS3-19]|nr:hypothetical protein [Lacihabitans sp. LS3-19]